MPWGLRKNRSFQKVWGQMQKRAKKELGAPQAREGNDGSEALRSVPGKGLFKFVKEGPKWKCTRYMRAPLTIKEEINEGVNNIRFETGGNIRINGNLKLMGSNNPIRFFDSDNSHYSGFKAHATTTASVDYVLPAAAPVASTSLLSDSSGNLSWGGMALPLTMADDTILGNISGVTGVASALTGAEARTLMGIDTDDTVAFGDISSGAVIWAEFPFNIQNAIYNRYYFRDVDDLDDFRKWDSNDTDPTGFNYRNVAGSYTVPENCTLRAMSGVIASQSGTENPTVHVFTGSVTEGTGDTSLSDAGSVTVTIGTSYVPYKFSDTYDVDLSAGDIIVPMIRNENSGTTPDFYGSLTLRIITR